MTDLYKAINSIRLQMAYMRWMHQYMASTMMAITAAHIHIPTNVIELNIISFIDGPSANSNMLKPTCRIS